MSIILFAGIQRMVMITMRASMTAVAPTHYMSAVPGTAFVFRSCDKLKSLAWASRVLRVRCFQRTSPCLASSGSLDIPRIIRNGRLRSKWPVWLSGRLNNRKQ